MNRAALALQAVEQAKERLDRECPRVCITWKARWYRRIFGVWPPEVAAENWARAQTYRRFLDEALAALAADHDVP